MTDEQRLMQTLENIQNDTVVISRLMMKYEAEAEAMSVFGASFSTWCDAHGVPVDERKRMLHKLIDVVALVDAQAQGEK